MSLLYIIEQGQGELLRVNVSPCFSLPLTMMAELQCDWTVPASPSEVQYRQDIKRSQVKPGQEPDLCLCSAERWKKRRQVNATLLLYMSQRPFHVLVFRRECALESVFSAWASCMYVRTAGCLHADLFVAGLAPWERILHLSILESRALILPKIHQRLTFFTAASDRVIAHTVCLTHPLSLFWHAHSWRPIFTLRALQSLRDSHCHAYTHSSVISLE